MPPLCSSSEGSTHRKCLIVGTRSVRRASGLLETANPDITRLLDSLDGFEANIRQREV
jgi:hypothetical protein